MPGLLAGHELQRAMRAEMQHGVGGEILAHPAIEGAEGVGGGEALLEQQAHRVALVAERRLHADEDVAETSRRARTGWTPSLCARPGAGPHCALDLVQMRSRAAHGRRHGDAGDDVGFRAEESLAALPPSTHARAAHRRCRRHIDRVAGRLHRAQRVAARRTPTGRRPCRWRPALGGKLNSTTATFRSVRLVRRSATSLAAAMPPASSRRATRETMSRAQLTASHPAQRSSVCEPSQRHADRSSGRCAPSSSGIATIIVASTGSRPRGSSCHCAQRLEFHRMCRDIRHVQRSQQRSSAALRIVVGRTTDQRESGQRHRPHPPKATPSRT